MEKRFIGIDLGGTSIKMGLVDESGTVINQREQPTAAEATQAIEQMVAGSRELAKQSNTPWVQIQGIGVGLPGFLDIPRGMIVELTNLNWKQVPIRSMLEEQLQKPVRIDNDANVAAFGEAWCGAGKGVDDLICVTLGTGVGGGVIVRGSLVYGHRGFAGEIGHIQIDRNGVLCNCGQIGCLETISSATGIARLGKERMAALPKPDSLMPMDPGTYDVFHAAQQGDALAGEVIQEAMDALARAFAQLSVILNPSRFVVGGGVSKAGELLFRPLREAYARTTQVHVTKDVEIIPAALGNQAGFIGAAGLVAHHSN